MTKQHGPGRLPPPIVELPLGEEVLVNKWLEAEQADLQLQARVKQLVASEVERLTGAPSQLET